MTITQRLVREPNLIVGILIAGLGLVAAFGVALTDTQLGAVVVFLGTVVALIRYLTTPAGEVAVQVIPGGDVVAGAAAVLPDGTPLEVTPRDAEEGERQIVTEPVILKAK